MSGNRWLIAGVTGAFALYLAAVLLAALGAGLPPSLVSVWDPSAVVPQWVMVPAFAMALSGVAVALVIPAIPWVLVPSGRLSAGALFGRAFALNLVQAVAFISVWKAFAGAAPPRFVFIGWQALVAIAGLLRNGRAKRHAEPGLRQDSNSFPLLAGVVLLVVLPLLLWAKVFVEDASGDGTEAFEFARSLASNQLPYWDLENGYYGFYPNFMLFAYPTQLSFLLLGEVEGGQRFPVFLYVFGISLVLREIALRRVENRLSVAPLVLLGAVFAYVLYHSSYPTYEIVADLGEPFGVDVFFAFLASAACYALLTRQRMWWGVFAFLMTLALSTGLPFVLIMLAGWVASQGRWLGRSAIRPIMSWTVAFATPWLAYQVFLVGYQRAHPLGVTKWAFSNLTSRYPLQLDLASVGTIVGTFVVLAAVVPVLAVVLAFFRRDRIARSLAFATIGYLLMLVAFGRTHPHYLTPITLFPVALYLRWLSGEEVTDRVRTAGMVLCVAASGMMLWRSIPARQEPVTTYRAFGAATLILYDSYPDLVRTLSEPALGRRQLRVFLPEGKALFPWQTTTVVSGDWSDEVVGYLGRPAQIGDLREVSWSNEFTPWGMSFHTWVRYADRVPQPGHRYTQILAAPQLVPAQPEGFLRRDLPRGWVLYYRPESVFSWLGS